MSSNWETLASKKRQSILDQIPAKWHIGKVPPAEQLKDVSGSFAHQYLTPEEIEITQSDAVAIADKVAAGEWSAVAVTEAYCHRAAIAHQVLNCLHEVFFDAALADAKALDDYYVQNGKTRGPLHGVPVSLKDQFHVKDVETTMGYVGWIDSFEGLKNDPRTKTFESELVRELRECGAVLYCKTSVPHTLMAGETVNHIIGYTWNPKNRYLSSGGSSGGEGALIGFRGSPVGFGSDIGGSIRIPAAFNGLFGLRPTSGRIPYEGTANSMDGQNSVLSVLGPIATTIGGVKLATKAILSTSPWLHDPLVVDMPWRTAEEDAIHEIISSTAGKKLAFGVLVTDGVINPLPPITRAMTLVVEALRHAGHDIVPWTPPSHRLGNNLVSKSWMYDGGRDVFGAFGLSGEPPADQIKMMYGDSIQDEYTGTAISANNVAKRRWQKDYLDYWNSTVQQTSTGRPVDGLICPLAPYPAARPNKYLYYGYSMFVNGLDYTSVVLPVTNADKTLDAKDSAYKPLSDLDKTTYDDYDVEMCDGAHVAVQVIGRRYTEEKMITIVEYISSLLGRK